MARRRCSPWPGRSGAVERAQTTLQASSPPYRPSAPKNERKEVGNVATEYSSELGATPASDSRRTVASHLGRAHAGAYRSDGECAGALGGELEALVRSAASGGAFSGNGARRSCCCCAARAERGGRGTRDRMDGVAWEPGPASRPGGWRWPAAARPSPAYGRHVADARWDEAGAAHAGDRGGGGRPGRSLGRKGGGVGPVAPVPFSIIF